MSECRYAGRTEPRVLPGRHTGTCRDPECLGCQPCDRSHCRVCGVAHVAGACPECMAETREALREIGRLCGSLPEEVEHRGVEGEAMMLLGPAADPEARGHLEASALAGRIDPRSIEGDHLRGCRDGHCLGCAGQLHPAFTLGRWEDVWRDALDHDPPAEVFDMAATVDYLDRTMAYMSTWPHVPFEEFARDMRRCLSHLEAVLHEGEQIDQGAPCMTCNTDLRRVWKGDMMPWSGKHLLHPEKAREDGWACPRCRRWHTENQYRAAVLNLHNENAEWLTDTAMEIRTKVKAGTVRVWATRGEVSRKRDQGRTVYSVADVLERAGQAS